MNHLALPGLQTSFRPGATHLLRSLLEQAVYLVLVSISLISHEMTHHGNNDKLLGWKHSQSKAKQNVKLLQPQCPRLPSYLCWWPCRTFSVER